MLLKEECVGDRGEQLNFFFKESNNIVELLSISWISFQNEDEGNVTRESYLLPRLSLFFCNFHILVD